MKPDQAWLNDNATPIYEEAAEIVLKSGVSVPVFVNAWNGFVCICTTQAQIDHCKQVVGSRLFWYKCDVMKLLRRMNKNAEGNQRQVDSCS
jgi:hypothetical protein